MGVTIGMVRTIRGTGRLRHAGGAALETDVLMFMHHDRGPLVCAAVNVAARRVSAGRCPKASRGNAGVREGGGEYGLLLGGTELELELCALTDHGDELDEVQRA